MSSSLAKIEALSKTVPVARPVERGSITHKASEGTSSGRGPVLEIRGNLACAPPAWVPRAELPRHEGSSATRNLKRCSLGILP
jgi:hypothetical protein